MYFSLFSLLFRSYSMKNLSLIVSFFCLAFQAQSATISWDVANSQINSSGFVSQETEPNRQKLSGGVDFDQIQGPITDTWAFIVDDAGPTGVPITSLVIEFTNSQMDVDTITLDGTLFTADNGTVNLWSANASLNDGVHFVTLNEIQVFDEIAQYDLKVSISPVPIPSALWLFGSAIVGLIGFTRKLNQTNQQSEQ